MNNEYEIEFDMDGLGGNLFPVKHPYDVDDHMVSFMCTIVTLEKEWGLLCVSGKRHTYIANYDNLTNILMNYGDFIISCKKL